MKLYIGKYRGNLYETVYGFIKTGYWYMGGKEAPYHHDYYGIIFGEWTFGLGIIKADTAHSEPYPNCSSTKEDL